MQESKKTKDNNFISSKVNDIKKKIYKVKEKTKEKDVCEEMELEHSEELSPDDFD